MRSSERQTAAPGPARPDFAGGVHRRAAGRDRGADPGRRLARPGADPGADHADRGGRHLGAASAGRSPCCARAQRQLEQGVMPVAEVFEGLCLLVAGALLLTPGFLTDTLRRAAAAAAGAGPALSAGRPLPRAPGRAGARTRRPAPAGARARGRPVVRRRVRGGRGRRPAAAARQLGPAAMILVRHAESEWNRHYSRTRIDPGIPDPPLTADGRAPGRAADRASSPRPASRG